MIDDALLLRTKYGLSTDHLTNGRPLQATAAAAILGNMTRELISK